MQTPPEKTQQERFLEMWEWVKNKEGIESDSSLLNTLGYKSRSAISEIRGGKAVSDKLLNALSDSYGVSRKYVLTGSFPKTNTEDSDEPPATTPGDEMRNIKAFGDTEDPGLIHVPVNAQANYSKHFMEPVFTSQLKRWKIPDFPYKGDKYRMFGIEGDSMQYIDENGNVAGLHSGMDIVAERVEQEDWDQTVQWYIHVIVFEDMLTIKRLFREDGKNTYVLIPDNPSYPQKRVRKEDIKELWIMKRYLGWNTPPPKKYEISI